MTLPTKDQIHKFLNDLGSSLTKREMIDAFHIKGDDRVPFKRILREMEDEGLLIKEGGKSYRVPDALPAVTVIEVTEIDIDGDVIAKPAEWDEEIQGKAPRIEVISNDKSAISMKQGDRALAKVRKFSNDLYEAQILKRMNTPKMQSVGLLKQIRGGYIVEPMERNAKFDFEIAEADFNGARPGEIVVCEIQPSRSALRKRVRVIEVIGAQDDPKAISLVALHQAGLRAHFPDEVIESTKLMEVPPIDGREDLRRIPLVTIDGKDARDFDDAVFAEPDKDGFHLIVAIADVSYYVRPNSPLDKEAYLRGNSTYFPDRVVPMLPERLSNDLCSLRPHEPRATLAVHMWINEQGKLLRHKFVRGLMQSHARLTYEQVQAARDGVTDATTEPLMRDVIEPLYTAWKVLDKAREKRGALDLDVPERKIVVDEKNEMTGVAVRERLNSHRLIEEFMILANVAAAEALEKKNAPCVYRVHDRPSGDKLMSARSFLEAFGLNLPKEGVSNPGQINHILKKAKEMKTGFLINEVILRSQAQAVYDPENIGHFGLALERYAHFTSPIRRYADLIVHRSLIKAYDLGEGGLSDVEAVKLTEMAEHISMTERASAEAERNSVDRFTASFLKDKIGAQFPGRIGGVTKFGLFVKLIETGSDGLVPIRTLPSDYYIHDESQHALIGRRTGRIFRLGAQVLVRLVEADPLTGSTLFELINGEDGADIEGYNARSSGYNRAPRQEKFRKEKGKTNRRGDGPNTPRRKKRDHKKRKRD